jgi:TRAP-type mannitol/chloroaromatic compound transport system permease small subunit
MESVAKVLNIIDIVNEWTGRTVSFLILTLSLLVFADVFMRYVFNNPILWGMEVNQYQLVTFVFLSGGYTYLHHGHVEINILYGRWSPKTKARADLFTCLFIFLVSLVLVGYGTELTVESYVKNHTMATGIQSPLWPGQLMIPIGGLLLGLQCLAKWIRDIIFLVSGKHIQSKVVKGEGGIFVKEKE